MIDCKAFLGVPIAFGEICYIYPPTVLDVIGSPNFYFYKKILTKSQEDLIDEGREDITPFQDLLNFAHLNKENEQKVLDAFFFFTHQKPILLYDERYIVFEDIDFLLENRSLDKIKYISEKVFFQFQNIIREASGAKPIDPPIIDEDPRVARIKAKGRKRERIKQKQLEKKGGLSLKTILVSICCMGLGFTPLNIRDLSYASILAILNKYQKKEKYDFDTAALLSEVTNKKKISLEYWVDDK